MVQVQAPLGANFTLYANGKAVSEQQIGKTAEQEKQKVTAFDYYAVDLKRGNNTLRGVATDINGKIISEQTINVLTPDSLQAIDYRTQDQLVPADGISEYQVVISLKDRDGRPYVASTPITIDTNIGRINLKDSSNDKAGTQITVNGRELLILRQAFPVKASWLSILVAANKSFRYSSPLSCARSSPSVSSKARSH